MRSDSSTSPPLGAPAAGAPDAPGPGGRLLGALSYAGPGFLIPMLANHTDPWVRWHAAQGFVVFFLEALALGLAIVVDATIGRVPWIGLLVMLTLRVGLIAGFVVLSVIAAVKALAGERNELPFVGRYARQIPGAGPESGPR